MGLIFRKDYSAGWCPSFDSSGPANALLQMTNLQLDEKGALIPDRGTLKANTSAFAAIPHSIFSKILSGAKHRFVALTDGSVLRDVGGGGSFSNSVLTGGSTTKAAFGTSIDQILILSGTKRKKFDGTNTLNLGVIAPTAAPTFTVAAPYFKDTTPTYNDYTAVEGTGLVKGSDYIQLDTDSATFRGVAQNIYSADLNTTAFNTGVGGEDDRFGFNFRAGDTSQLVSVTVEYLLDTPTAVSTTQDVENRYQFTWVNSVHPDTETGDGFVNRNPFSQGVDIWTKLETYRDRFIRFGNDSTRNWTNVKALRITVYAQAVMTFVFNDLKFSGGDAAPINGEDIQYVQVNVRNTGRYTAVSAFGLLSLIKPVINSYTTVTPQSPVAIDTQVNEVWIYRRGGGLDKWYRVKVSTTFAAFDDKMSAETAIALNIVGNPYLVSLTSTDIPDDIVGVEGPFFERTLYFTKSELWISEPFNPDSCDSRYRQRYASTSAEIFLWAKKISAGSILVGTTAEIYELTGDLTVLPDGFLNLNIRATGVEFPPVSDAVTVDSGVVYYMSSDGWTAYNGSKRVALSTDRIDSLFKGKTRYGYAPVSFLGQNLIKYDCAITKGKLWTIQLLTDGLRQIYVYDFIRDYWHPLAFPTSSGPFCFTVEEDGTLLCGWTDLFLRVMDVGTLFDGATQMEIAFLSTVDDGGLPRNRKDGFNLKLNVNTAGGNLTVKVYRDNNYPTPINTYIIGNVALDERNLDIHADYGTGKRFQLGLTATGINPAFKFQDWSIDFQERPIELTYLRIPPENYGVQGRKRLSDLPMILDTRGGNATVTAYLDGVSAGGQVFNNSEKLTITYQLTGDQLARDIGFTIISNSVFEFYELVKPRVIDVLPDAVRYFRIPYDNLGTSSRKRITAIAFVIDTGGAVVEFTPIVDGVAYPTFSVITLKKETFIYYFTSEVVGIDIGGILNGLTQTFEYYGIDYGNSVSEKLPPSTKYLIIPETNFGIAAKKRIRTLPMLLNTRSGNVTFTPVVDGISHPSSVFNTLGRRTVFHYFNTDIFGIDFKGILDGASPFEFYEMLKPENVQILPVGKLFDQIGPIELNRLGKLRRLRTRLVAEGSSIPFNIFMDDISIHTGSFTTLPNIEKMYQADLPKGVNGTLLRIELGPTVVPFYRNYMELKVNLSGQETEYSLIKLDSQGQLIK